jgi:hypothetical protein
MTRFPFASPARLSALALALAGCIAVAHGQADLNPTGQYPQFRTLSGLSGGGFGVRPDGSPGFDGALSFSTPIGYGLSNWHLALTAANTSDNLFFKFPHLSGHSGNVDSNGKLSGLVGASLGHFGSITGGVTLISSVGDTAVNLQYQAPYFIEKLGLSVGVQDLAGRRGIGAENLPGANGNSQSWFTAATYQLPYGIYASIGDGTKRFSKGFGNVSVPFERKFKAVLEHDGFNFNEAVAYDAGALKFLHYRDREVHSTIMVGLVRSKYAFFSLNVTL